MHSSRKSPQGGDTGPWTGNQNMSIGGASSDSSNRTMGKRQGKRPGRKPSKVDEGAKLERSRQSARECRARKKLRYQYLEELVLHRERAVFALRDELETYKQWCVHLDNDGQVPDSLLKMIVNEDMAQQRKQMEQAKRSMIRQQEQEMDSSSSSSSTSSPASEDEQSRLGRHHTKVHPQTMLSHSSSSSLHHHSQLKPDHTSHLQQQHLQQKHLQQYHLQQHHQQQHLQQQSQTQSTSTTSLQRQMAIDKSPREEIQKHQSQLRISKAASSGQRQDSTQRSDSKLPTLIQLEHQQKQQKLQHQVEQKRIETSMSSQHPHTLHHQLVQRQQMQFRTSTKSEPSLKYEPSFNRFKTVSTVGKGSPEHVSRISALSSETKRARSFSNPASMVSLPKLNVHVTSTQGLSSSSKVTPESSLFTELISTKATQGSTNQQLSPRVGLFTGSVIRSSISQPLSLNIPTSLTVEESSSSDENISEQQLFPSTLFSQKRTLCDSDLPGSPKRSKNPQSETSSISNYDPQAKLKYLTTVHCYSTTRTSNTPSPSSFGLCSSGLPSPTSLSRYAGKASSTPSTSAATSPAPLSSLSSLLDLSVSSPGLTSSTFGDPSMDLNYPSIMDQTGRPSTLDPGHCSATGLTASIDEPIPELYSFLADLEEGGMSTLTSRHGASSNHSTPLALTPKPSDQPLTPDPSFLNVPKIIDEFLDSDDQDL